MPNTAKTLPEQIIENSMAFTKTLEMENAVFQAQLNGSIEMTVKAFRELIVLCKESIAVGNIKNAQGQQNLADTVQQAISDVQQAAQANKTTTTPAPETSPANTVTEAVLDSAVLHSVALSYENAVSAQQQAYILQQAATTQVISTILSIATATLSIAVKEAESGK